MTWTFPVLPVTQNKSLTLNTNIISFVNIFLFTCSRCIIYLIYSNVRCIIMPFRCLMIVNVLPYILVWIVPRIFPPLSKLALYYYTSSVGILPIMQFPKNWNYNNHNYPYTPHLEITPNYVRRIRLPARTGVFAILVAPFYWAHKIS